MSIYQSSDTPRPDSDFESGELAHLVEGNAGRLLDPRRTPVTIVGVHMPTGTFCVRIDDFEDRGAIWETPFEKATNYQFERGSARATPDLIAGFRDAVTRLDRPLEIGVDDAVRRATFERLAEQQRRAGRWLASHSRFLGERGTLPDPEARVGDRRLQDDLRWFMEDRGLLELEMSFARQFVSNPCSGDLVKAHRIVIAELGLAAFADTVLRDPAVFEGSWSRERRAEHVLARLAFLGAVMNGIGVDRVTLFRGMSTDGPWRAREVVTFVSTSFSRAVAESHFTAGAPAMTGVLMRQTVPVTRLFMTYLETAEMNERFREAEAVLLVEDGCLF